MATNSKKGQSKKKKVNSLRRVLLALLVLFTAILASILLNEQFFFKKPPVKAQINVPQTDTPVTSAEQIPATITATLSFPPAATKTSEVTPQGPTSTAPPTQTDISIQTTQPSGTTSEASSFKDASIAPGSIYISLVENGYAHLFAYHPQTQPLTRVTNGDWDDIHPAASPDGQQLVFASNRNGYWDLFILDLQSGETSQLTDTPTFEAAPSWSPDGQWIVYEAYIIEDIEAEESQAAAETSNLQPEAQSKKNRQRESLEIFIRPAQGKSGSEPIRLTNNPAADFAPVWSPNGRLIAFVSTRTGDEEIWLADLDRISDRFSNLSHNPAAADRYPAWSPDGNKLAWASTQDGFTNIWILDAVDTPSHKRMIGNGNHPAWDPTGQTIITTLERPNRVYLTGYHASAPELVLPAIPLPGSVKGLTWSANPLPAPLPKSFGAAAASTITPGWQAALTHLPDIPSGRQSVVQLSDVEAPYPLLQDLVDEAFDALRKRVSASIGWDYLSTLENAYVPLTAPLFPGMRGDWLYTGRAIAVNTAPINAGWMLVVREDFGSHTYWRILLRTRFQDGSQGQPIHTLPWNFNARYSGDPYYYEQGGALVDKIPTGYWVDLTQLAASYGWERVPALISWRSAFGAARFNEFVYADGRDWLSAMAEIYPPEALATPTPILPPTYTPTATRWPTRTPTPTRTPWPSRTPTPTRTGTPTEAVTTPMP